MEDDDLFIDMTMASTDSITITTSNISTISLDNGYTINGTYPTTITLDDGNIDLSSLIIDYGTDFVDRLPDFDRVESMCKEYPALEKAYENFKIIYKMVEQDYNGKQKERE